MFIRPWCTITLDGVEILGADDFLEEELVPPLPTAVIQPADYLRAGFRDRIGRKLVENSFSFTQVRRFGNGLMARYFGFSQAVALPTDPGDCIIRGIEGGVWTLKRAVRVSYTPKVYADRFTATYTITGGEFVVTTQPPVQTASDLPTADVTGNIIDNDGSRITDGGGNNIIY